ncbi:hypothetical protein Poly51_08730 [Rubripirellula tenax]|uniref:Uncharacterized protein n=1 Tax=Rubripirellula tenax TaxID=2528015 RepID=A0A5C6FIG6_9BACT|nr:hypothetical protein Poly51_08730 [Rubripirellula tenax]
MRRNRNQDFESTSNIEVATSLRAKVTKSLEGYLGERLAVASAWACMLAMLVRTIVSMPGE